MLCLILFLAVLVIGVIGLPPVMLKQPVESEMLFKISSSGDRHKAFDVPCEVDSDPIAK